MRLQHRSAARGSTRRFPPWLVLAVVATCCVDADVAPAQSTVAITERLRVFNQRRSGAPSRRSQTPAPTDRAFQPASGWGTTRPRRASFAGDLNARRTPADPGRLPGTVAADFGGHSMPTGSERPRSVYNPTTGPEEVVRQTGEITPAAAQIPQVIPPQDTRDPNLMPPLQEQPEVSTWQRYRQEVAQQRSIYLQSTFSRGTWLFGGDDKLGMFDVYVQGTFQSTKLPGFAFTPYFQAYFLDGPISTDLPPRLYLVAGEFRQFIPVGQNLIFDIWVAPGVFSDFEAGTSDAFRFQAKVVAMYQWSPFSQFLLGFLYLDREDVKALPIAGWIYVPNDEFRLELVFPRPKIAFRLSQRDNYARWFYIAGEFGGDSFAIERANGMTDTMAYRDLRLIFGFEQKYVNGRSFLLEAGYIFDRKVEYDSGIGDFDPGSTGMLRAGLIY